jgi:hypothetical protein
MAVLHAICPEVVMRSGWHMPSLVPFQGLQGYSIEECCLVKKRFSWPDEFVKLNSYEHRKDSKKP